MYHYTKYKARKTVVDGVVFDSKKEAKRYTELKQLEKAGKISDLQRQVRFELIPTQYYTIGKRRFVAERAVHYVADFTYLEDGKLIVEDVKGIRTDVYKIKKKLMRLKGYEIRET